MNIRRILLGLMVIGAVAGGCGEKSGEEPLEITVNDIEPAQEAVASFKKALQTALREGLREGPENAIDVCQIKAPVIARGLSEDGVTVGRTSHRLRNPANAPASWMKPLLAAYLNEGDESPWRAVRLDDGSIGYAEPIYMQPVCLKCHGSDLTDTVTDNIAAAYPDDDAVGFASGEFRGLFWVKLDAGSLDD